MRDGVLRLGTGAVLAAALVIGASGCSNDAGGSDDPARADAQAACAALDRVPTPTKHVSDATLDRWVGAAELAAAAAAGDDRYKPLADALGNSRQGVEQTFRGDNATTLRELKKARKFCKDL